ncbi:MULTISPECIES: NAD-dependent epimerase/dehydratase family protein [Marinobacter]|uniref:Nucleoside-diphosphate-sugar epimerase n=1 Tax=Marinobacter segnicrescens TaxID=430453 RepID=A0A1I0F7R8_9GAMM|nr:MULTISPECIES: NAD-dependent epimerase/dehydratase family protein [Marinobacter]UZD65163.1 NAD-dependent epimerase/dehydratase family protein [Marinobacter sp. AN1]SET54135.1 Nucleoside-diphosphate-sugar epimerase [Marinobacter segnicrescens]
MAISADQSRPHVLVAGCGSLGGTIASALTATSEVWGIRRTASAIPKGVHPAPADLMDRPSLAKVVPEAPDILIYCLTPSTYDDAGYRAAYVDGLANLLAVTDTSKLKRLFFISSTSVYGQDDDSQVDETSPVAPRRFSGQRVLEGEQLALDSGVPATIIRFSGIYGPGRGRFLESVMAGELNPDSPGPYTNRIHEQDAMAACVHLVQRALEGKSLENCYLASDCEPARLDDVVAWIRQQLPCQPPRGDGRRGGRGGSKRCDNQRLLATGFSFTYPDFRSGYRPMIEAIRNGRVS